MVHQAKAEQLAQVAQVVGQVHQAKAEQPAQQEQVAQVAGQEHQAKAEPVVGLAHQVQADIVVHRY